MNLSILPSHLKDQIANIPHSRTHLLNEQPAPSFTLYIKRDDELSFGISGSKLRKYHSLLTHLHKIKAEKALLIGGPFSNHLLGCSQLLIENKITPFLLLKGKKPSKQTGNFLLTSLFIPPQQMCWAKDESNFQGLLRKFEDEGCFIVEEGAFQKESLEGALTLPLDILRNEQEQSLEFSHLFIEAGTGLMAMALIFFFALVKRNTQIHVILLADSQEIFIEKFLNAFFFPLPLPKVEMLKNVRFYTPQTAKSFGSTNQAVFKEILHIARAEGFLTDPIYSAKLIRESKDIIKTNRLTGNGLVIHSGGGLTLMGFQDNLRKLLK